MKKTILLSAILLISVSLFGQQDTTQKPEYITPDSIQKLQISEMLVGKWVLISTKAKKGSDEEKMTRWGIQTLEFNKDRTLTITPGPRFERKIYWSYIEKEGRLMIFSLGEKNIITQGVKFPVMKLEPDMFTTTEWENILPEGKHYQKLQFLKTE